MLFNPLGSFLLDSRYSYNSLDYETIEGISLACKSQEEFDMKYNKGYYRASSMPSTNYAPNYTNQAPKEP